MDQQLTDLDKQILEIANKNWEQFVMLIGEDAVIKAKICLLRQKQKSYGEIVVKLSVTKEQVRYACRSCDVVT